MLSRRFSLVTLTFFCLCACTFSFLAFPVRAFASSDPITVTSQTSTVSFPKSIDFLVSARDTSAPITRATIYIMYNGQGIQELYPVAPATPSEVVTLHWHEDTSTDHFTPPGTQVGYYWKIEDSAGNTHTATTQTFQVTDTRFTWQHLSRGLLQVNWYNRPVDLGRAILQQASTYLQQISTNLGEGLRHPINLWIYANIEDLHTSLSPQTHEWVGGVAIPSLNQASIVVADTTSDTLVRDMPHELTHLVFHQIVAPGITPTWFDEGLAVYNQQFKEPMMSLIFKDALKSHTLLSLKDITLDFPNDANKAYLAYAESWNLVDYMYNTFKQPKMAALIKDMGNPQLDFNQDIMQALGIDVAHLENQWHLFLKQPGTLTTDQLTPMPESASRSISVISTTDSNAPLLLTIGWVFILLSLIIIASLFAYQWRTRNIQIKQQAQHILNTTFSTPHQGTQADDPAFDSTEYASGINPSGKAYSSPTSYTPPAVREVRLPDAFIKRSRNVYPSSPTGGKSNQEAGKAFSPPYQSGQGYANQYPEP